MFEGQKIPRKSATRCAIYLQQLSSFYSTGMLVYHHVIHTQTAVVSCITEFTKGDNV